MSRSLLLRRAAAVASFVVAASAQVQWTERALLDRFADPVAFDAARGRLVLYSGGRTVPAVAQTWEWDGALWAKRNPAVQPPARSGHGLVHDLVRGRTVLFGGFGRNDTWEWDGSNWQQMPTAVAPSARAGAALAFDVLRGRTVLFGGQTSSFVGTTFFADTWEWDGVAWSARTPTLAPPARAFAAVTYDLLRARTVLFGGENALGRRNDTWEWDGATWQQALPPTSPPARSHAAMTLDLARGRCVLFGGIAGSADTWEWDGVTWLLRPTPVAPPGRGDAGLAFDSARGVVLCTGGNNGHEFHGDLWQWDGAQWSLLLGPAAPSARHGAALAADGSGRLWLFGGVGAASQLDDTWEWDGQRWLRHQPAARPAARGRVASAFDTVRGRFLVFGGELPGFSNELWGHDGVTWQLLAANGPDPRVDTAMAFDQARGRAVLFGGTAFVPSPRAETWEWDGVAWSLRTPAVEPPPRAGHAMAYDARRQIVVLFGGAGAGFGNVLGDTWEWDGTVWSQRLPALAPPPRVDAAMAYDPVRERVVLFGGGSLPTGDTWEWDGIAWTQRLPTTAPPARSRHRLAFDAVRECTIVFGGQSTGPSFADLWELAAVTPAAVVAYGAACAGSAGLPQLTFAGGQRPWLGDSVTLQVDPTPTGALVVFALGASDTTWAGHALPFPLDGLGMPGCAVHASLDEFYLAVANGAVATLPVAVPPQPSLLGQTAFLQAGVFDAGANAGGLVVSNGVAATIGAR